MHDLQSLQGHCSGSHIFMAELKTFKTSAFFKSAGTNSESLGLRDSNNFVS